jgi:3-oxoacyl-[acyl-carrier protein] reductase
MFSVKGQVCIVTGGAKGIGKAICEIFCKSGATVALWDILESGQETCNKIIEEGGDIFFQKINITDPKSVDQGVAQIIDKYGKIDILINNAGVVRDRSFTKMSKEEWDTVIDINLNAIFLVTKAVFPIMKKARYGRIISASSINGFVGAFGQANYAATKAGIVGFTRALCKEGGKYGITVNSIAPGHIKTDMTNNMPPEMIKSAIEMIPLGRAGTPKDIAYAYLFLASKEARFINGITLHANGGVLSI